MDLCQVTSVVTSALLVCTHQRLSSNCHYSPYHTLSGTSLTIQPTSGSPQKGLVHGHLRSPGWHSCLWGWGPLIREGNPPPSHSAQQEVEVPSRLYPELRWPCKRKSRGKPTLSSVSRQEGPA
jgi:hypothetical protein